MRYAEFHGRRVQVIEIDDVSGEHVIEFVDSAIDESGAALAIYGYDKGWSNARVSISPRVESVPAEFIEWALELARRYF